MAGRSFKIGGVLELRDKLSGTLKTAGRNLKGFGGDLGKADRPLAKLSTGISGFAKKLDGAFGAKSRNLIRNWMMGLKISSALGSAALSAFFLKGVNQAANFEESLRKVTSLTAGGDAVNGSAKADSLFTQYSKDLLAISPTVAQKPEALATGLYDVVSAGFEGADALKVLQVAAKAATAGNADLATSTKTIVQTLRAYGKEAGDAQEITDLMFQGVNKGIFEFSDLASSLGNVVGAAAAVNVPFKDLMAAMEVMTLRGLGPEEAVTSLNQVLLSLIGPTEQSKEAIDKLFGGAKKAQEEFSASALAKNGLAGVMDSLSKKLPKLTKQQQGALQAAGDNDEATAAILSSVLGPRIELLNEIFPNVRALRGALLLAADSGVTFKDAQQDMLGAVGATDRAFDEWKKSTNASKKELGAYIDVLKIMVFSSLLPSLNRQLKSSGEWLKKTFVDNPVIKDPEATFGAKLKVIKDILADTIGGFWEDHKDQIATKAEQGATWFGNVMVPKMVNAGIEIGKAMAPALWDGFKAGFIALLDTPAGVGIITSMLGIKLAAAWSGAGKTMGGAGGAGAGGAAGGMGPTPVLIAALGVGIAAELGVGIGNAVNAFKGAGAAQQSLEEKAAGLSVPELEKALTGDLNNFATGVNGLLPGHKQPREVIEDALDAKRDEATKGLFKDFGGSGGSSGPLGIMIQDEANRRMGHKRGDKGYTSTAGLVTNAVNGDQKTQDVLLGMSSWLGDLVTGIDQTKRAVGTLPMTSQMMADKLDDIYPGLAKIDVAQQAWSMDMQALYGRLALAASTGGVPSMGPGLVTPQRDGQNQIIVQVSGPLVHGEIANDMDIKRIADSLAVELAVTANGGREG